MYFPKISTSTLTLSPIVKFPKVVNSIAPSKLKKCGLSRQKIRGIKELAKKYINKKFNPRLINKMNDEEAIQY